MRVHSVLCCFLTQLHLPYRSTLPQPMFTVAHSPPSTLSLPSQLQVLLMSVYSLGVVLEDPFDTGAGAAPDTVSLTEFMHTLAYVSGTAGLTVTQPSLRLLVWEASP